MGWTRSRAMNRSGSASIAYEPREAATERIVGQPRRSPSSNSSELQSPCAWLRVESSAVHRGSARHVESERAVAGHAPLKGDGQRGSGRVVVGVEPWRHPCRARRITRPTHWTRSPPNEIDPADSTEDLDKTAGIVFNTNHEFESFQERISMGPNAQHVGASWHRHAAAGAVLLPALSMWPRPPRRGGRTTGALTAYRSTRSPSSSSDHDHIQRTD